MKTSMQLAADTALYGVKMDEDIAGLRFTKPGKRNTSNMVAVRMPALLPESAIIGMQGRIACEIVESKVFTRSKHASKAVIVEAGQETVRGKPLLFLILDRVVCQPPFQKKGDRVLVIHPSVADGARKELSNEDMAQQIKQEREKRCHHG